MWLHSLDFAIMWCMQDLQLDVEVNDRAEMTKFVRNKSLLKVSAKLKCTMALL